MRRTPRFKEMLGRGKKGNDREEGEAGRGEEEWGWAGGSKLVRTREAAVLLGTNPARCGVPGPDLLLLPGLVLKEARDVEGSEDVGGRTCKEDEEDLCYCVETYILIKKNVVCGPPTWPSSAAADNASGSIAL